MLLCVLENRLKGLGDTVTLNAGTVHTRPSLNICLLNQSHVQILAEKVTLPFSRQINPKIQGNSSPVQEIPISHIMRDTVIFALATTWILICAVMTSVNVPCDFNEYEIQSFNSHRWKTFCDVWQCLRHLLFYMNMTEVLNHTHTFTTAFNEMAIKMFQLHIACLMVKHNCG